MCGRFGLKTPAEKIAEFLETLSFEDVHPDATYAPRYNIAPTTPIMVAMCNDYQPKRHLSFVRWGLIPFWAKDPKIANKLINARGETLAEKPSFKAAFKYRRCIIPASGFYEWLKTPEGKVPHWIYPTKAPLFGFAGLWEVWTDPGGGEHWTATIITTAANKTMAPLHHRMPVILAPHHFDLWLDRSVQDTKLLSEILLPSENDALTYHPVSKAVNRPGYDHEDCIARVDL
jgi:putative SOS response-associated peptidase YedK